MSTDVTLPKLLYILDVISDCTTALRCSHSMMTTQSSRTTSKLYYRRAKASEMIGDADGAVNDMKKVLELEVRQCIIILSTIGLMT